MQVKQLTELVLNTTGIEGITLVGGEPFAQAGALAHLAESVRRAGLSVMVYSGYTFAELQAGTVPHAARLLSTADLLMDGRYSQDLPTDRPWRGSDNQRLVALSDRYANRVEAWNGSTGQDFEVHVRADGTLEILGIPPAGLAAALPTAAKRTAGAPEPVGDFSKGQPNTPTGYAHVPGFRHDGLICGTAITGFQETLRRKAVGTDNEKGHESNG
jgi:anaerobic ribonucleoside-triphosphate reductase activating protein